jgi:thioredoxin 1
MQWLLIVMVLVIVLVAALQIVLLLKAKRQEGRAAPPLEEVLPEGVKPQPHMLFYFYSEHCGPCKAVTPLVDELGSRQEGVVKVDVRRHMETARRFGVMGTPTLVRVEEGRIVKVHVGGISSGRFEQFYAG